MRSRHDILVCQIVDKRNRYFNQTQRNVRREYLNKRLNLYNYFVALVLGYSKHLHRYIFEQVERNIIDR